jgi:hypothetical protein
MTDPHIPDGRLDLRALAAEHDPARVDAVIGAVMSRIETTRQPRDDLASMRRYQRVLLAAAAVLAAVATAAVVAAPRRSQVAAPTDVIASWTETQHVPTNGELLAAYQGYRP